MLTDSRKKLEVEIMKSIHSKINVKLKINVLIKVIVQKKSTDSKITGKIIPGIDSIIAIASGKGGVGTVSYTHPPSPRDS